MARQLQLPRLSQLDVENLARSHQALVAVDHVLRESKRADAASLIELVGTADAVIAQLFNKAESSIVRQSTPEGPKTPGSDPLEQGPDERTHQPEIASSARPEP